MERISSVMESFVISSMGVARPIGTAVATVYSDDAAVLFSFTGTDFR